MTRIAYDATNANAAQVRDKLPYPDVMLWYGTGSADVQWTSASKALFPARIMCEIDQGGAGSPSPMATVRDVETGAWTVASAISREGWTAARPTIYCDRDTLPSLTAAGWDGDIWLAWPGWTGQALPDAGKATIVAVQDANNGYYDHTTITDPYWPNADPAAPVSYDLSITITSRACDMAWSYPAGTDHFVLEYTPSGSDTAQVLSRPVPPADGAIMRVSPGSIPGQDGGTIKVTAIVDSQPVLIGSRTLA